MLEHRQLALAGQFRQRLAFEHAILGLREISIERPVEEEIPAIDPGRVQLGFFDELEELVAFHPKFDKPGRGVYTEHGADLAMADMIIELAAEVRVGQPIAISNRVMIGVAEIASNGPRNAS